MPDQSLRVNHLGQPIGEEVGEWKPPPLPAREPMTGRYCRLEPLERRHAQDLWDANAHDTEHRNWTYLPYGPYADFDGYAEWVARASSTRDPLFFAVLTPFDSADLAPFDSGDLAPFDSVDLAQGRQGRQGRPAATGVASYLRIAPEAGSIEVGHINFSPLLQRTPAATEAMYLMMKQAFELGYRRYEWKCDALNAPSRAAAERLGLTYEGVFRQAIVYKGRNRDSAWYAAIDREWPPLAAAFERWLAPENFDAGGTQRSKLRP